MHYTYDSWQQWLDKAGQYTSIWAEDNFSKGKRVGKSAAFYSWNLWLYPSLFFTIGVFRWLGRTLFKFTAFFLHSAKILEVI